MIKYDKRLGLREHVLKCGNYLNKYNLDALIVFEDDVLPSKDFFLYAYHTTEKYIQDDRVAGVSLYSPGFVEIDGRRFEPLTKDDYDIFFMQYSVSWGQVWFRKQWNDFYKWYLDNLEWDARDYRIPSNVLKWPDTSWKRYHVKYCIDKDKFFVYPYLSRSTCFSEVGVHTSAEKDWLQVILSNQMRKEYCLPDFDDALKYDAYHENINLFMPCGLKQENLEVNLNGLKTYTDKRYILTTQMMEKPIIKSWANKLIPHELNILYDIPGSDICLYDIGENNHGTKLKSNGYYKEKYEQYFILMTKWMSLKNNGISIADYVIDNKWKRIGIYGWGNIGKLVYEELKMFDVEVECIIDNYSTDERAFSIQELESTKPRFEVDCIIVTPFIDYYVIKQDLERIRKKNVVSIEYIIDKLIETSQIGRRDE